MQDPHNPHAKPEPGIKPRPAEYAAPRLRTGQPNHLRQARYTARRALQLDVRRHGVDTKGKTLKQIRIAVARAKAAEADA